MSVGVNVKWSTVAIALALSGCGGSDSSPVNDAGPNVNGIPSLDKVYAYSGSDLEQPLVECSKLFKSRLSCHLDKIRPLGAEKIGQDLTLDDIRERLVVSHDWMADAFMDALVSMNDQDLLNMFRPLNAVVLSYDIRPSFYHRLTASMYIDPLYLWRNKIEWDTISQHQDFRQDYAKGIPWISASRFIDKDTKQIKASSNYYDGTFNATRTSDKVALNLYRLLAHELAHANDFLPPNDVIQLGTSGTVYANGIENTYKIYEQLYASTPMQSELLRSAAQTAFRGEPLSSSVKSSSASDVGNEFSSDGGAHFYGYSQPTEDVATLFESYMMYKRYNAIEDVGFMIRPENEETATCDQYTIGWGQSHRLADPKVRERTIYVAQRLLDKPRDYIVAQMPPESEVATVLPNIGWCASRTYHRSRSAEFSAPIQRSISPYDFREDFDTVKYPQSF